MRKMYLLLAFLLATAGICVQAHNLKVWMSEPVLVPDGKTVTYLTVYQTDFDAVSGTHRTYMDWQMVLNVPKGVTVNQKKVLQGRDSVLVNDLTLNEIRYGGISAQLNSNMADSTSIRIITSNQGTTPYYPDDTNGNMVEELFTIGLVADSAMEYGKYEISLTEVKFVQLGDKTGAKPTETPVATLIVKGDGPLEEKVTLIVSNVGFATLMIPFDAEIPAGLRAYTCTGLSGDYVMLEKQDMIKANTPLLVEGREGTYIFKGESVATEDTYTVGLLTGVYSKRKAAEDMFVLTLIDGKIAFYPADPINPPIIGANRCYLSLPSVSLAKALYFDTDNATSIAGTNDNIQYEIEVYDLNGQRVLRPDRGIYIIDGKKIFK